jgi:tetratricopeptide (TPR) repeat protein
VQGRGERGTPLTMLGSSRAARVLGVVLALGPLACASQNPTGPAPVVAEGPVPPIVVNDADFAAHVHALLRDGNATPARQARLVGTVRRKLAQAASRFDAGNDDDRAADGVLGALLLVRRGELDPTMIDAEGARALAKMVERVSARGDEGRAEAFLRMRRGTLAAGAPELAEIDTHLAAISAWQVSTRSGTSIEARAAAVDAAVARAIVEPTEATHAAAVEAVDGWITAGIARIETIVASRERPGPLEADALNRVNQAGAFTLAALFLRNGDAAGALDRIERGRARDVTPPGLASLLAGAAEGGDARRFRALAVTLLREQPGGPEGGVRDPDLLTAALFGTTLESYRRDPADPEGTTLLARLLLDIGLPEAAPLVLADGLGDRPRASTVATALELVALAAGERAEQGDFASVRRILGASQGLLAIAASPGLRGRVTPAPEELQRIAARAEVRAGNLAEARPLFAVVANADPSVGSYMELAHVERQLGDRASALEHLDLAARAPDASVALLDVANAELIRYEIERDGGDANKAKDALERALGAALAARRPGAPRPLLTHAERLLGRILDGFGDGKGAARALDRSLTLAEGDRGRMGAAMLAAVGGAFVRRDVPAARAALHRALDAEAPGEDLVYGGLWLQLLERSLGARGDDTAERALGAAVARGSWVAKLAAWASSKLSDAELTAAASTPAERVEAKFYVALAARGAGNAAADATLREVANAPVLDLIEVQLARDLTAPALHGELPRGLNLP